MANTDNQSQRFIYIRSLKEKVPCTEQQFQEFYREATRIRKKEQYYHRCKCPNTLLFAIYFSLLDIKQTASTCAV